MKLRLVYQDLVKWSCTIYHLLHVSCSSKYHVHCLKFLHKSVRHTQGFYVGSTECIAGECRCKLSNIVF